MPNLPDLFPGFASHHITVAENTFFVRTAGDNTTAQPLLLLHGFPQTHVCWHKIAPDLARHYSIIVMDLRGYGASSAPASDETHIAYSKRTMARDCLDVMEHFGHQTFTILGHDRGARVAYRLALDHPDRITSQVLLDIIPTYDVWQRITPETAIAAYHWAFLAQPEPLPETLIGDAPEAYLHHTLASWTGDKTLKAFDERALAHYRELITDPKSLRAMCEDYRAGATCDREFDRQDLENGRRISCPTHLLWGSHYVGKGAQTPLEIWQPWCTNLSGAEIDAGHFLAEENPQATLAEILRFLQNTNAKT